MNTAILQAARARQRSSALVFTLCVVTGFTVAATHGSTGFVGVAVIIVLGIVVYAAGADNVVALLVVTCPIGLEQVTSNQRSLLSSFGGFAVSSVRLGIILGIAGVLLLTRGLPRRLVWQERVYLILPAFLAVTLIASPDVFDGLRFTAKVAALPAMWLSCGWLLRKTDEDTMWRLLLGALALLVVTDFVFLGLGSGYSSGTPPRFQGIVGAAPAAAMCTGALALAALYRGLAARQKSAAALYVAAAIPLFLTLTRTGIAAFAVASIFLAILLGRARYVVTITAILALAIGAYSPLRARILSGGTGSSWQTIIDTVQARDIQAINTEGRLSLWEPLAAKFHESPFLGSGVGASAAVLKTVSHDLTNQAHSDYLALAVNGGLVAVALWFTSLGGLLVRFARVRGPAAPAAAAILLYLIAAITDNAIEMYGPLGIPVAALIAIGLQASEPGRATRGGRFASPISDTTVLKVGEPGWKAASRVENAPGRAANPGGKNGELAPGLEHAALPGGE